MNFNNSVNAFYNFLRGDDLYYELRRDKDGTKVVKLYTRSRSDGWDFWRGRLLAWLGLGPNRVLHTWEIDKLWGMFQKQMNDEIKGPSKLQEDFESRLIQTYVQDPLRKQLLQKIESVWQQKKLEPSLALPMVIPESQHLQTHLAPALPPQHQPTVEELAIINGLKKKAIEHDLQNYADYLSDFSFSAHMNKAPMEFEKEATKAAYQHINHRQIQEELLPILQQDFPELESIESLLIPALLNEHPARLRSAIYRHCISHIWNNSLREQLNQTYPEYLHVHPDGFQMDLFRNANLTMITKGKGGWPSYTALIQSKAASIYQTEIEPLIQKENLEIALQILCSWNLLQNIPPKKELQEVLKNPQKCKQLLQEIPQQNWLDFIQNHVRNMNELTINRQKIIQDFQKAFLERLPYIIAEKNRLTRTQIVDNFFQPAIRGAVRVITQIT